MNEREEEFEEEFEEDAANITNTHTLTRHGAVGSSMSSSVGPMFKEIFLRSNSFYAHVGWLKIAKQTKLFRHVDSNGTKRRKETLGFLVDGDEVDWN